MSTTKKWDLRFLTLAQFVGQWSKDPSTKTGAVIVREDNRIVSLGFNGLPRGVQDNEAFLETREIKLATILHAETNALLFARGNTAGATIYTWPLPPCAHCASQIIQAGITRVVSTKPDKALKERWGPSVELAQRLFAETGIAISLIGEHHA